jgi:hypothetical protein
MRRRLCIIASTIVLVLMLAMPATARPTRVAAPASPGELVGPCPFTVGYSFPRNDEYSLLFGDPADPSHIITTGAFWVTLTNVSNDNTITLNISGPGRLDRQGDGSSTLTAWGTWLFFFFPDQLGPNSPGMMVLNNGRTVIHTEADGFHQQIISTSGTSSDVCAMLA